MSILCPYILRIILFVVAPASYAQARIWFDERIHCHSDNSQVAIYNMPFLYRLSPNDTLSIKQLRDALQLTVNKHQSLRTSLVLDAQQNILMQRVIDANVAYSNKPFIFIESTFETDEELSNIMQHEQANSQHFDLSRGLVFRCYIVYHKQISRNDFLSDKDAIIFNFHHTLFDFPSMHIFLHDLNQAYTTRQLPTSDDTDLRYLDCKYTDFLYFSVITNHFSLFKFRFYY